MFSVSKQINMIEYYNGKDNYRGDEDDLSAEWGDLETLQQFLSSIFHDQSYKNIHRHEKYMSFVARSNANI